MQTCDRCNRYKTCTTLCATAEKYVNQDYVSARKFPNAKLYPEGSERFWNGYVTLDWIYSLQGLGNEGNCATLENMLDEVDLSFLSAKYREVIRLFYYENNTLSEISVILDTPLGTVHSRFNRAKREIYKQFKGHDSVLR